MPISTTIDTPAALYALMTTSDTDDLAQSYIQTANIDMTGFSSESIARNVGPQPYNFSGTYDGGGYIITIGGVVGTYTGLFASVTSGNNPLKGIISNINVIYNSTINITVNAQGTVQLWGGLVGFLDVGQILDCSVTINGEMTIISNQSDTSHGLFCGFTGQDSVISGCQLIINNDISLEGSNSNSIGLFCGENENSRIYNCSITTSSSDFDIDILSANDVNSNVGLICGDALAELDNLYIQTIIVNLNNNGNITFPSGSNVNTGIFCGQIIGNPGYDPIQIENCIVNINNNQILSGIFNNFFGQIDTVNTAVTNCQLNYTTTTANSPYFDIVPVPSPAVPMIYTNSYTNIYILESGGNYYIPNTNAILVLGDQSSDARTITLESQTSPDGIKINEVLENTGTTFSSSVGGWNYTVIVKGVGSMYFSFNYSRIPDNNNNNINSPIECICEVNSCSTIPQTGITADSRITNTRENKTIRVNVDREFARNAVIYPKFKSYSDYMKYLQAGLKY